MKISASIVHKVAMNTSEKYVCFSAVHLLTSDLQWLMKTKVQNLLQKLPNTEHTIIRNLFPLPCPYAFTVQ